MLVIENGKVPDQLVKTIRGKRCTAVIGSGLSLPHYMSWLDLVRGLCQACGITCTITRESPADDFLEAAQEAKNANPNAYFALLGMHFGRVVDVIPLMYQMLLSLPFDSFMTFNFDPFLAIGAQTARQACTLPPSAYPALDRKRAGNRSLHYLHGLIWPGHVPVEGQIVLAAGEFQDAYSADSGLMNFLVQTIEYDPMLFVGCRLQDPPMQHVFGICKQHQLKRQQLIVELGGVSDPPPRFIVLPVPYVTDVDGTHNIALSAGEQRKAQAYYENLDITPVWYEAPGNDHSALLRAFQNLADLPSVMPHYGW